MTAVEIYLETGRKKVFASAIDWPGWSRAGRDIDQAIQALLDYAPRYAKVLKGSGLEFSPPSGITELDQIANYPGNATTDFGAPAIIPDADQQPFDQRAFDFSLKLLHFTWGAFDKALQAADGKQLKKGPRGGGRDIDQIISHVFEAERGYLSRIAWQFKSQENVSPHVKLRKIRQAIRDALLRALEEGLPEQGSRGGKIWPARYFVRRATWHTLDHAWEIEDRIM